MPLKVSIFTSENSPLEERVFGNLLNKEGKNVDQIIFTDWLSLNGHISPRFVSRAEFETFQGHFLREEKNDTHTIKEQRKYTLILPVDLTRGELIQVIDTFRTKLNLDDAIDGIPQAPYVQFLAEQILGLRMAGISRRELERELTEKYHISPDLLQRVKAFRLSDYKVAEIRQKIAEKSNNIIKINTKISQQEIKTNQQYQAETLTSSARKLPQVLDIAVFHQGRQLIRYGLNLINTTWQEAREKDLVDSGNFTEIVSETGLIFEEKKPKDRQNPQNISFRFPSSRLDKQEKNIRQSIQVDEYRQKLKTARNKKDTKVVIKLEKQFTSHLLKTLHQFPYQFTHTRNGYSPRGIVDTREIQCVGFALIAHAYLSELGIIHHGLDISKHSALSVTIGGVEYFFDATGYKNLYPMKWKEGDEGANEDLNRVDFNITFFGITFDSGSARRGNPEIILQGQILLNYGMLYYDNKQFQEAINCFTRVIELDPKNSNAYKYRVNAYSSICKFENANAFRDIKLDPKDAGTYYTYGKIIEHGQYTIGNINKKDKQSRLAYYIAESISEEDYFRDMSRVVEANYKKEKGQIDMILRSNKPDRYQILQEWFFNMYDD